LLSTDEALWFDAWEAEVKAEILEVVKQEEPPILVSDECLDSN
jgi:hypothetical protein